MEKCFLFIKSFIPWIRKEDKYVGKVKSVLFIKYNLVHLSQASSLRTHIYHPSSPRKCQIFC